MGPGPAAALAALLPPLRFATRDGFAGLPRLVGFGETLRSTVARARDAGASASPELTQLADEAHGFDALDAVGKRRALVRIAAILGALIPLPDELRALARMLPPSAAPVEPPATRPPTPVAAPAPPPPVEEGLDPAAE